MVKWQVYRKHVETQVPIRNSKMDLWRWSLISWSWAQRFFFFPWKSKVPVKRVFYHFFGFFHGCKTVFTGTFFEIFTPSPDFSRGLFGIFSRVRFKISRAQNQFFSREGYIFHGQNFRKEIKKAKKYNFDTHKNKKSVQKKVLLEKNQGFFTGTFRLFTGTIFEIFHVHKFEFHGWNFVLNFHGDIISFTGTF